MFVPMAPQELLAQVRRQLRAAADPEFRAGEVNFFRETVDPYGVRSPDVKRIEQSAWRELKHWPAGQRNRFCEELWKSGKLEEATVAIYLYRRLKKECGACEFKLFERWIDRYVHNWANCDGVASWLLAASIENEPTLAECFFGWTKSPNRWKRRAAAVAFLQEAKQGRRTADILRMADKLLQDPDDMVQKGVGWLLKEAYPKKPRELRAFLQARKVPRLILRLAAEKMTREDRAAVRQ
jgi:3-methyladenine DNA glycosylase AlkD